ncbi:hypothetical protein [Halarcobacter sp.]|uniref:hypothetical protein n=1 Tax=Halarcobacter sp. TaxID=2321133 RepID=UPI0029F52121|nr:hypothetical protein [Halarcobacter sp.]
MKLYELIKNQRITFDTHQAGDGQEVKWRNVHLEKSIKGEKGKIRFPFLGKEEPSNSGMSNENFEKVKTEVKKILKKNTQKLDQLGQKIESELERFSQGVATVHDAEEAAKRFAEYFDLKPDFIDKVVKYRKERLSEFTTLHFSKIGQRVFAIKLTSHQIMLEERKSRYLK